MVPARTESTVPGGGIGSHKILPFCRVDKSIIVVGSKSGVAAFKITVCDQVCGGYALCGQFESVFTGSAGSNQRVKDIRTAEVGRWRPFKTGIGSLDGPLKLNQLGRVANDLIRTCIGIQS